jgi:tRNA pseudouridine32 synthase/23S rRNA pseudouridine746 synthase
MTPPQILFEDGEALVINKPAGLPVDRPKRGGICLEDHLDALRLGFMRQPIPVHRLDTDTSGCLLLARNPKAVKRFAKAFEEKAVTKRYLGILAGLPEEQEGRVELPLAKISSKERGWRMVPDPNGKASATGWSLKDAQEGLALIEFSPETGRTHQIRVHAECGIEKALLGDPIYGQRDARVKRTMLHASAIIVKRGNKPDIVAAAPMPADFVGLGFQDDGLSED